MGKEKSLSVSGFKSSSGPIDLCGVNLYGHVGAGCEPVAFPETVRYNCQYRVVSNYYTLPNSRIDLFIGPFQTPLVQNKYIYTYCCIYNNTSL